jgi:hypothetical protein
MFLSVYIKSMLTSAALIDSGAPAELVPFFISLDNTLNKLSCFKVQDTRSDAFYDKYMEVAQTMYITNMELLGVTYAYFDVALLNLQLMQNLGEMMLYYYKIIGKENGDMFTVAYDGYRTLSPLATSVKDELCDVDIPLVFVLVGELLSYVVDDNPFYVFDARGYDDFDDDDYLPALQRKSIEIRQKLLVLDGYIDQALDAYYEYCDNSDYRLRLARFIYYTVAMFYESMPSVVKFSSTFETKQLKMFADAVFVYNDFLAEFDTRDVFDSNIVLLDSILTEQFPDLFRFIMNCGDFTEYHVELCLNLGDRYTKERTFVNVGDDTFLGTLIVEARLVYYTLNLSDVYVIKTLIVCPELNEAPTDILFDYARSYDIALKVDEFDSQSLRFQFNEYFRSRLNGTYDCTYSEFRFRILEQML